ncbi:MAG: hypothetical protein FJY92_07090 [Candidatus Hydrogenedentes bacterium]|nr:hypothetical protein [Candidatus Hydrogenedentota bacterium]
MIALIEQNRNAIEDLCRRYGVKSLDVFGSAVDATFEAGRSDIDFWVEFFPKPPGQYADDFFALEDALKDLLGTRVDLVEAKAQRNPYFIEAVNASKVPLYAAA